MANPPPKPITADAPAGSGTAAAMIVFREATSADGSAVAALWTACGLVVPHNDPAADFRFALDGNADVAAFYERLGFEQVPRIVTQKWLRPDDG